MIIDADCHISAQKHDSLSIEAQELIAWMDRAEVDRALVWLKPPYDKNIELENRAVYEAAQAHPSRLLPFGWTNPRLGHNRALDIIRQCFEEYGFLGIKFNGAQDGYVIDDDELVMPLIEKAAAYAKPLAFHIGADFYENTHPYRLKRIAQLFPETTFLMVHMGGAGKPALARSAVEAARECPNIVLIGSEIDERYILDAIYQLGAARVCFGSDSPFNLMHVRVAMYQAMLSDLSPQEQAQVMGGNIAQVINL
jgi:uncharacterized protein